MSGMLWSAFVCVLLCVVKNFREKPTCVPHHPASKGPFCIVFHPPPPPLEQILDTNFTCKYRNYKI